MNRAIWGLFFVFSLLAGCGPGNAYPPVEGTDSTSLSSAIALQFNTLADALNYSEKHKTYIVALVIQDGKKDNLGSVFEDIKKIMPERAVYTEIDINSSEEHQLIAEYDIKDTPKPLILLVTCHGDAISLLPADTKVNDIKYRLSSNVAPELIRSIKEKPVVMLLLGPPDAQTTKKAREAADDYGASIGGKFSLFFVNNSDEKEAFFVRGAGLSPKSRESAIILYHQGEYKGRLTGEITAEKISKLVAASGCSC